MFGDELGIGANVATSRHAAHALWLEATGARRFRPETFPPNGALAHWANQDQGSENPRPHPVTTF